jgi:hypothetical protein
MYESEAEKIYKAIFDTEVPESIQKQFNIISERIDFLFNSEEIKKYNKSILQIHDLEALEVAARYMKKLPLLTLKFKIMVYLGETLPENYPKYINENDSFFTGFISLFYSLIRTSYKLVKGIILIVINRL